MIPRSGKRSFKLHPHLKDFITSVLSGEKSNRSLHRILKYSNLDDRSRSRVAISCYSYLRWHHIFTKEIGSADPNELAMAASMVFLKEMPKDHDLFWERRKAIKATVERSKILPAITSIDRREDVSDNIASSSVPEFISSTLINSLGKEKAYDALADSLLHPRYIGIRTNTLLSTRDKVMRSISKVVNSPMMTDLDPDAFLLPDGTRIDDLEEYRQGLIEVQDISSQIACRIALAGIEGLKVVDACAGNGGKTLALSALMKNRGMLISMDTNERSLQRLRQRGRRAQIWNYQRLHVKDPSSLDPYREWADLVLVDAPCSGLGTMRRNPDIKIHLKQEDMERFPMVQYDILKTYSDLVKPGGRLVYSTCSMDKSENGSIVERFLKENEGFHPVQADGMVPYLPKDLFRGTYFHPMPGDDRSGFFAAIIERVDP
ncbi:MAG: RsmB/NOP family class I SAM-dependent RNA methyltransferase [Candidatus Thermoplasmatota archaeon]|nr:RsmB/NOP family class I SAM-dependent RNA methyltransferase [Candidatus Thermoplasmatota archaeon]